MNKPPKKIVVIHSGGMDSSICLALAMQEYGKDAVLSLTFDYGQRHQPELTCAAKICVDWGVEHDVITLECLVHITQSALIGRHLAIQSQDEGKPPNTLVMGRNGLMARLGAIYANQIGVYCLSMGVLQLEEANSGYRDCSRKYIDLLEQILRIDLDRADFCIKTPIIDSTKLETVQLAHELGILQYLIDHTVTCYEGLMQPGCQVCPACLLRNEGLEQFRLANPEMAIEL